MTVAGEEAPANSVPAAAVRRRAQALFGITGRKARAGGPLSRLWKSGAQPREMQAILADWRSVEANGIPGVAVECVDIRKNTSGEGG